MYKDVVRLKKRILSLTLSICLVFGTASALPNNVFVDSTAVTASAETATSGKCGENVSWSLDSKGVLTISGTGEMYDYYDYEDEERSPFSGNDNIKSVVIKNGVTSIGSSAFYDCTSLKSVSIPDSVTSIGDCAFENCSSLASITIPDSVTSIENSAFSDCTSLASITIPNSVTSIGYRAFLCCTSLKSITIPDSVTSIGEDAFYGCTSLKNITIPNSVTSIESYTFYDCPSLKSISIPGSVTSIEDYAFGYYYDENEGYEKKVDGFKIYGYSGSAAQKYAVENGFEFNSLGNLTGKLGEKVTFEIDKNGVLTISGSGSMYDFEWGESPLFDNSLIKKVVIKGGVTSIGGNAF